MQSLAGGVGTAFSQLPVSVFGLGVQTSPHIGKRGVGVSVGIAVGGAVQISGSSMPWPQPVPLVGCRQFTQRRTVVNWPVRG